MSDKSLGIQLIIILILTLINGFFAASEMAMISVNKKKLQQDVKNGNKKAKLLLNMLNQPSRFLSTIQVGITFAGFFSSASAAVGVSNDLGKILTNLGLPFGKNIAFIGVTLILSYIMLVFGELVPKRIALKNPTKFAMIVVRPISMFAKIMKPFVSFLSISTNTILAVFGIKRDGIEEKITMEEIKLMVEVGHEQGLINPSEKEMLYSIISFDDKTAEEVMTARIDVFIIDVNAPAEEYVEKMLKLKFSRVPVYENDVDNIIGILYLKDYLLDAYRVGFENINLYEIIKPPYFIPEHKNINDLFIELRQNRNHLAVLIDEYGSFSGIVTLEDLIEEIVGDIEDEYDLPDIKMVSPNTYIANGNLSIKELNSALGCKFDEKSEFYDTLGGLLIYNLSYIPSENSKEIISLSNIDFKIQKIKDRKIKYVEIKTSPSP